MKTLAGWIVGIFGLGLVLGSFFGGTAALETTESTTLEEALAGAPLVDCGSGREAVLEPVLADGKTTVRVKCVPTAPEPAPPRTPAASPVVVYTAASAPAPEATPRAEAPEVRDVPDVEEKKSRSIKESALIIGGSAGAGAGIGAIAKGKKGAAVGAAIGGVAGTVYDLMTRNKK